MRFFNSSKSFSDDDIDRHTLQIGGWSWFPPAVVWLYNLGLNVELFSEFNYKNFAEEGELYLKKEWDSERFNKEKDNGSFKGITEIQEASKKCAV